MPTNNTTTSRRRDNEDVNTTTTTTTTSSPSSQPSSFSISSLLTYPKKSHSLYTTLLNLLSLDRDHNNKNIKNNNQHGSLTSTKQKFSHDEEPFEIETFHHHESSHGSSSSRSKIPLIQMESYLNSHLNQEQLIANKLIRYTLIRHFSIWSHSSNTTTTTTHTNTTSSTHTHTHSNSNSSQNVNKHSSLKKQQPLSFLFVGPYSSGKLYTCKLIAKSQQLPFVYFDMRYFSKEMESENFIQTSVNANQQQQQQQEYKKSAFQMKGQLNTVLKRAPNAVIVLNHLNSACESVLNHLYQILNEGRIRISFQKDVSPQSSTHTSSSSSSKQYTMKKNKKKNNSQTIQQNEYNNYYYYDLDCKNAIFIGMIEMENTNNMHLLKSLYSHNETHDEMKMKHQQQQQEKEKEEEEEGRNQSLEKPSNDSITLLTQMLQYREKLYPYLLHLFNNENNNENNEKEEDNEQQQQQQRTIIKCHDSFFNAFTCVIPYFEFSNLYLSQRISQILYKFKSVAREHKGMKLTWSEDVIIWLRRQFLNHNNILIKNKNHGTMYLSIERLIEVHVLTRLALVDSYLQIGDHIHLNVLVPTLDRFAKEEEAKEQEKKKKMMTHAGLMKQKKKSITHKDEMNTYSPSAPPSPLPLFEEGENELMFSPEAATMEEDMNNNSLSNQQQQQREDIIPSSYKIRATDFSASHSKWKGTTVKQQEAQPQRLQKTKPNFEGQEEEEHITVQILNRRSDHDLRRRIAFIQSNL